MCLNVNKKIKPYNAIVRRWVYKVVFEEFSHAEDTFVNLFDHAKATTYKLGEKVFSDRSMGGGLAVIEQATGIHNGIHVFTKLNEAIEFVKCINNKDHSLNLKDQEDFQRNGVSKFKNVIVLKCEVDKETHVADGTFTVYTTNETFSRETCKTSFSSASAVYHSLTPIKVVHAEPYTRYSKEPVNMLVDKQSDFVCNGIV